MADKKKPQLTADKKAELIAKVRDGLTPDLQPLFAYQDGYLKTDCQICKWQSTDWAGDSFCKLYKKCGNPKYCRDNDASKCSMFGEDREMIQRVISDFNDYIKENPVDVWKGGY